MRVNVYAEKLTDRVDLIVKQIDETEYTAIRFYLELPVSLGPTSDPAFTIGDILQVKGPFLHRPDDDDSSAVTFWGKRDLIPLLEKALTMLYKHYGIFNERGDAWPPDLQRTK